MNDIAIFVGPSLCNMSRQKYENILDFYPPATAGDILSIIHRGYKHIILVDGTYYTRPSPWHKEILYAIKTGVTVVGCSSYGAIRSSELYKYGMIPSGRIAYSYISGRRFKDSDVAILHLPSNEFYLPTTISVVDLEDIVYSRYSFYSVNQQLLLQSRLNELVLLHFTYRDFIACKDSLAGFPEILDVIKLYFKHKFISLKERDAQVAIDRTLIDKFGPSKSLYTFDIDDIVTPAFCGICAEANYRISTDNTLSKNKYINVDQKIVVVSLLLKYLFFMGEDVHTITESVNPEIFRSVRMSTIIETSYGGSIVNDKIRRLFEIAGKYKSKLASINFKSIDSLPFLLFEDHHEFLNDREMLKINWLEVANQYLR